jgi:hypothetical protein
MNNNAEFMNFNRNNSENKIMMLGRGYYELIEKSKKQINFN